MLRDCFLSSICPEVVEVAIRHFDNRLFDNVLVGPGLQVSLITSRWFGDVALDETGACIQYAKVQFPDALGWSVHDLFLGRGLGVFSLHVCGQDAIA